MTSRLAQMQARFQQKQMQEKEEKLLKLYENQQQRRIERVSRGSAGSDGSITTTTTITTIQGGKVRQMFDERRQKAGIDRSYPLEPLKTARPNGLAKGTTLDRNRNPTTRTVIKSTVQKTVSNVKNGKPLVNKREVREIVYNNDNDVENYEEHNYADDSPDNFSNQQQQELISLMNDHNLNDNLDNEELPSIGLDECDEPLFTGKLPNVGGKLPSQNGVASKKPEQRTKVINGKASITPARKENKPDVKKTIIKSQISPKRNTPVGSSSSSYSSTPKASTPTSPSRTTTMSSKGKASAQQSNRAPSTNRPSARPSARNQSAVTRDDLAACQFCNRRFATDRLQIHEEICARTAKKKRKAYDALKHRVQGTELEPFVRKGARGGSKMRHASGKKSNWRQTHEEFISTIRAAKMAQQHIARGGKLSDLPPPPPSSNPDYVECPHCGRRFNETAAERHIPKCATYEFNKPKNPPQNRSVANRPSGRASFK